MQQQEGNGPIYFGRQGLWKFQILVVTWWPVGHQTISAIQFNLRFETSSLYYPGIHVHIASNSHFGELWGHGGLQMASKVTSSLWFGLIDLKNLCSHVSLASNCQYSLNLPRPNIIHWLRVFGRSKKKVMKWKLVPSDSQLALIIDPTCRHTVPLRFLRRQPD